MGPRTWHTDRSLGAHPSVAKPLCTHLPAFLSHRRALLSRAHLPLAGPDRQPGDSPQVFAALPEDVPEMARKQVCERSSPRPVSHGVWVTWELQKSLS